MTETKKKKEEKQSLTLHHPKARQPPLDLSLHQLRYVLICIGEIYYRTLQIGFGKPFSFFIFRLCHLLYHSCLPKALPFPLVGVMVVHLLLLNIA